MRDPKAVVRDLGNIKKPRRSGAMTVQHERVWDFRPDRATRDGAEGGRGRRLFE
jgi:hypothetical protein